MTNAPGLGPAAHRMSRLARSSPLLAVGMVIVGFLAAVAILAPLLSPYDPKALTGASLEHPSGEHLLGTNDLGQDILSELIWGARTSLTVALLGATLAVALGGLVGVGAGLLGGTTDTVAMRVVDLFLALPGLPLIILIGTLVGPSRVVVVLLVAAIGWPGIARTLRSQTLSLRQRGFIHAARGFGSGPLYVMRRHLAPGLGPIIVTRFVDWAAVAVGLEAGLAFLGLSDPNGVSWGTTIDRAFRHQGLYLGNLWTWWILPAGLAISVAVMGFILVGVGVEPAFNPRWGRGRSTS